MSEVEKFKILLEQIDSVLESYQPVDLSPDRIIRDIFIERAKQRPIFEKAIQLATEGLEKYPFNAELLRRRALARSHIVTPDLEYSELELAEEDLRTILEFDPNNIQAGFDLLEAMYIFSGMENKDVAEVAEEFAARAESLLLNLRALQIKAYGYADEHTKAEQIYQRWAKLFPESKLLKAAKEDADSMKQT
jgi:tetratricopeptide (TPR) repeat protein